MVVKSWMLGFGWGRGLLFGSALAALGCGSDDEANPPTSTPPSGELSFGACPADLPGSTRGRACATTTVPLRWDDASGEQIDLMVVRYLSATPNAGQLWLLDGGPGGTGATYMQEQVLSLYASLGFDVFIPQHRGTGHSTPLACSHQDDLAACGDEVVAKWGEGLAGFHSVEAGRDVGHLIDLTRQPGEPAFVFGLSYGSYWAERYLQAFPKQADGVILEGVLPLGAPLWAGDPLADESASSIFAACRDEPDCAAAFGDRDPEDVAHAVLAASEDPTVGCLGAEGADRITIESVLSTLVVGDLAQVVPGLIERLDRCSDQDQLELEALGAFLTDALSMPVPASVANGVLGVHVLRTDIMSELDTFPLDDRLAAREPLVFWSGAAPVEAFAAMVDAWPVNYPPASTSLDAVKTPVLLMNGGLDIQTPSPWARELSSTLGATLVEFPFAGHAVDVSLASPATAHDASCSLGIIGSFMADPSAAIDGSCAAHAYTPDVAGKSEISQYIASVLYGDGASLLATDSPKLSPKARWIAEPAERQRIERVVSEQVRRAKR